ncbi:MAG: hypothetical protein WDA71_06880 [Actinomycetota bacterium]
MSLVLLLLLVAAWASVIIPAMTRARREGSPLSTIGSFERAMGVLSSTRGDELVAGRWVLVPRDPQAFAQGRARARVLKRRRKTLERLGALTLACLVLSLVTHFWIAWIAFIFFGASLGGYIALLVSWQRRRAERERVVRHMPYAEEDFQYPMAARGGR